MPAHAPPAQLESAAKPLPRNRRKYATTITLEPEVIAYLDGLQREYDRDRSYLLNALVKDFRRRREATLAPALPVDAAIVSGSV